MLYQPTNVIPSILSGEGAGVVDVNDDYAISWIVNGDSPLERFRVTIYEAADLTSPVYDDALDIPSPYFYGTDAKGNKVPFLTDKDHYQLGENTPGMVKWSDMGLANGKEYVLFLRQKWATGWNEQTAGSAFITRAKPVLGISTGDFELVPPPDLKKTHASFTGSYSQAQGDGIEWVRWNVLQEVSAGVYESVYDTGIIQTSVLAFEYTGFDSETGGKAYRLEMTVHTSSGVTASATRDFTVEYPVTEASEFEAKCGGENSVLLSMPAGTDIPGVCTPVGDYTITDDVLHLNAGAKIEWDTVNGDPMDFDAPYDIQTRVERLPGYSHGKDFGYSAYLSDARVIASDPDGKFFLASDGKKVHYFSIDTDGNITYKGSDGNDYGLTGRVKAIAVIKKNATDYSAYVGGTFTNALVKVDFTSAFSSWTTTPVSPWTYGNVEQLIPYIGDDTVLAITDYNAYRIVRIKNGAFDMRRSGMEPGGACLLGNGADDKMVAVYFAGNPDVAYFLPNLTYYPYDSSCYKFTAPVNETIAGIVYAGGKFRIFAYTRQNVAGTYHYGKIYSFTPNGITVTQEAGSQPFISSYHSTAVDLQIDGVVYNSALNQGFVYGTMRDHGQDVKAAHAVGFNAVGGNIHVSGYVDVPQSTFNSFQNVSVGNAGNSIAVIASDDLGTNFAPHKANKAFNPVVLYNAGTPPVVSFDLMVDPGLGVIVPNLLWYVNVIRAVLYTPLTIFIQPYNDSASVSLTYNENTFTTVYSQPFTFDPIAKVAITEEQDSVYVYIQKHSGSAPEDVPVANFDTLFYAGWYDGLNAGTISSGSLNYRTLYRKYGDQLTKVGAFPLTVTKVYDYSVRAQQEYSYRLQYLSVNAGAESKIIYKSEPFKGIFNSFTLIEAEPDPDNENTYLALRVWLFGNNINAGSVSNNNKPNFLSNFTKFPTKQHDSQLHHSGKLQALLKNFTAGVYADSYADADELFDLSHTEHDLFLKDMKGNFWKIAISDAITATVNTKTGVQETTVEIPWVEIADASDLSVIRTEA